MSSVPYLVPPLGAGTKPTDLADLAELTAFTAETGVTHFHNLFRQMEKEADEESEDFGVSDQELEEATAIAIDEILRREKALTPAYPFSVSNDGESLALVQDWTLGQAVYLFCLVASHFSNGSVIPTDLTPLEEKKREARTLFQGCATVSAAGISRGPSYWNDFPRPDGSNLVDNLKRVYGIFGDGTPKEAPPAGLEREKDAGIDVISWTPVPDGRPGTSYFLGQSASGENWKGKSIRTEIDSFHRTWFQPPPVTFSTPLMFIPFEVGDIQQMLKEIPRLGLLQDRLRLPLHVENAETIVSEGLHEVEGWDKLPRVKEWLIEYRDWLWAECS